MTRLIRVITTKHNMMYLKKHSISNKEIMIIIIPTKAKLKSRKIIT